VFNRKKGQQVYVFYRVVVSTYVCWWCIQQTQRMSTNINNDAAITHAVLHVSTENTKSEEEKKYTKNVHCIDFNLNRM